MATYWILDFCTQVGILLTLIRLNAGELMNVSPFSVGSTGNFREKMPISL